jgi:predicted ATPase/DNA-binding CsgD family transcriptional regulator
MTAHHNLPAQLTSFIGREHDVDALVEAVSDRRLVCLTGVGGCGKTRLALRVGERLGETIDDGPWLVDFSTTSNPAKVPRLVASALAILLEPDRDPVSGLARQLAQRGTTLIFDTCEHLLSPIGDLVDRLLRSCPGIRVIATSREPLRVTGEAVWPVPSLDPLEARRLFIERAQLVAPRLDVDGRDQEVDAVCSRVDRLPLGIELAAAWARVLPPADIAAGLKDSVQMLAGTSTGVAARHQTLNASITWSHALLDSSEQVLFRRLSVFPGLFTLDAAAVVCADRGETWEPTEAMQRVGRLLDKSLVSVRTGGTDARYRMLDTIRHYAELQLERSGEGDGVSDRHLDYFLRIAEEAEPGLDKAQDLWREPLDAHYDNFICAVRWGLRDHRAPERLARGCRLVAALGRYWLLRGLSGEGLDLLEQALAVVRDPTVRHRLLAARAELSMVGGRPELLESAVNEVLADSNADPVARARCRTMKIFPAFFRDFEETERLAEEAIAAARDAGDGFSRDWALVMRGYSEQTRNLHDRARATARIAYESSSARSDRFCAAFALGIGTFTTMVTGDVRGGVAVGEEVLELVAPLRDYFAVGTNTVNAAQAIGLSGDLPRARALIDPVVRSLDEADDADVVGFMVADGLLHLWAGELDAAVRSFQRGIRTRSDGTLDWTSVRCLPGLAGAQRRLGRLETARLNAEQGIELARRYGAPYEETQLIDELAKVTPDRARARDLLHRSLSTRLDFGLLTHVAESLEALAELDAREGHHHARAVRLLAAASAARRRTGFPRPLVDAGWYDDLYSELRRATGEAFEENWQGGEALALEEAVILAQRGRGSRHRPSSGWDSLSPTEREVVELVRAGMSNPEVAARLFMSRSTVKTHLSRVYQKLGVTNRTELAALASSSAGDFA